ncbi:MAG: hypothetical protein QM781_13125 [Chitinophagaceae bacterium]
MRKKILIGLNGQDEQSIYDVISEQGNYEKVVFSDEEINLLFSIEYFDLLNNKYGLSIDLYEEQVVCESKIVSGILNDTRKLMEENKYNEIAGVLFKIEKILVLSLHINACVYFVL